MSFKDWLKHRETKVREAADKRAVPDGIWSKCLACDRVIFQKEMLRNHKVCPECGHHFSLNPYERVAMLLDDDTFSPIDEDLRPKDLLKFTGRKPYRESIDKAIEVTGRSEAVTTGWGEIDGRRLGFGVMDFGFIGGSMGSVVGEKITRLFEAATDDGLPVVTVAGSGGARMQEGMFSLIQMAKTSAAVERHHRAGLPYISILANPTTGGVLASFSSLADIIIAEPKALVGFAGPRVIEQTLHQKLPKGFQSAESMLKHGMIDMIVERRELREQVARLIGYLSMDSAAHTDRAGENSRFGRFSGGGAVD
jgi:acetyl-CoA carboxylase carboxyl transferase subunit beta